MTTETKERRIVPQEHAVDAEVYAYCVDENGQETGYISHERWKTYQEIYQEMHKALDLIRCEKCGYHRANNHDYCHRPKCCKCGMKDWFELIDEYDSTYGHHTSIERRETVGTEDEYLGGYVCFCEQGSNEGYRAEFAAMLMNKQTHEKRFVDLYWIKSFAGMEHCQELVKRMMLACGSWPDYQGKILKAMNAPKGGDV